MDRVVVASTFDRSRLSRIAEGLVIATAVSLPWSTSATAILIVLWLIAVLPTLDLASVKREVLTAAGGLPVLLWLLAAIGMLWADVSWDERFSGLGGFHKLLLVPLLLAQFRRSGRAEWAIIGFLVSALVLLLTSLALAYTPGLPWRGKSGIGVPVKDYIAQSGIFAICALGLLGQAAELWRRRRAQLALVLVVIAAVFVADIVYVATSRTTLIVIVVLLLLFGLRQFGWRGAIGAALVGGVLAGLLWVSSPYLRLRVSSLVEEVHNYRGSEAFWSSAGTRIQFWIKSVEFVAAAPVIGHGTGSIESQFRKSLKADPVGDGLVTRNPHSQILAVAVQLGLLGTILLLAMWIAHCVVFRDQSLIAWFGLIVVVQNIVSSLFNSHLFDFTQGWLYVVGFGMTGGAVLFHRDRVDSRG